MPGFAASNRRISSSYSGVRSGPALLSQNVSWALFGSPRAPSGSEVSELQEASTSVAAAPTRVERRSVRRFMWILFSKVMISLTAPALRPWTRYFWMTAKTATTGTAAMRPPAARTPKSTL